MTKAEEYLKAQLNCARLTPIQWDGIMRAMEEYAKYCAKKAFSSANGETNDDHVIVKNFIHKNFDIFWANFVETESK